jgi:hypothetical protein
VNASKGEQKVTLHPEFGRFNLVEKQRHRLNRSLWRGWHDDIPIMMMMMMMMAVVRVEELSE